MTAFPFFFQQIIPRDGIACWGEHLTSVRRSISSVKGSSHRRGTIATFNCWSSREMGWDVPQLIRAGESVADACWHRGAHMFHSSLEQVWSTRPFWTVRSSSNGHDRALFISESDFNFDRIFCFFCFSISFSLLPNYPSFIFKSHIYPFLIFNPILPFTKMPPIHF